MNTEREAEIRVKWCDTERRLFYPEAARDMDATLADLDAERERADKAERQAFENDEAFQRKCNELVDLVFDLVAERERNSRLAEALEAVWREAHSEHCTNMEDCASFGGRRDCHYERPAVLAEFRAGAGSGDTET